MSEAFARRFPLLFHVTGEAALPLIRRHGLLCAEALCDLFGVAPAARDRLLARNRDGFVILEHPLHGQAALRRQVMPDRALAPRLAPGLACAEWRRFINRHVFLWAKRSDALRLERADPERRQVTLALRTAALLEAGLPLFVSPVNGGAIDRSPPGTGRRRGPDLYRPVALLTRGCPVREAAIPDRIPAAALNAALLP